MLKNASLLVIVESGLLAASLIIFPIISSLLFLTQVAELATVKSVSVRVELMNDWFTNGGVMIMGYEVFRILTHTDSAKYSKHKEAFRSMLLDPGKFI